MSDVLSMLGRHLQAWRPKSLPLPVRDAASGACDVECERVRATAFYLGTNEIVQLAAAAKESGAVTIDQIGRPTHAFGVPVFQVDKRSHFRVVYDL